MKRIELPSHRVVDLTPRGELVARPNGVPFAEARELFTSGDVVIEEKGKRLDVDALSLADFHALRAIATHEGWLDEEPVDITCINCDAPIEHRPCAVLAVGPFEERALDDEELDATVPTGVPHEVKGLGEVTLAPITLGDALPLHAVLGRRRMKWSQPVVRAMGIAQIDDERALERIVERIRRASAEARGELTNLFLETHYPPRLFSMARCSKCGARNDVDAPYEREFAYDMRSSNVEEAFVTFDVFAETAHRLYEELVPEAARDELTFVVDEGTPACDDGGVPLLGSYVPPSPGDLGQPSCAGEITVFFQTFRAMWNDEGAYEWEDELRETIEHEFEHHVGALRGDDPMDEEERETIDAEARRIHGRNALLRGDVEAFLRDFSGFWKRTWPLWILLFIVTLVLKYLV